MLYGVPQTGRNKVTNRVTQLRLYAENAGEEIALTNLEKALENGTLESFVVTYLNGEQTNLNMEPRK